MTYPTRRWLLVFVAAVLWCRGGAHAQALWRPVDQPVYAARGHVQGISPGEAVRHTADLRAGVPVHAWLEWDDPSSDLKLTVWRNSALAGSSTSVSALAQYLSVDPGRPGWLEMRVTRMRGQGPETYRLLLWQGERPQWSRIGTSGPSMRVGQKIAVVEDDGKPLQTRVVEIRPDRIITLQDERRREIPVTRIVRIERGDSLRNGALIGFALGAGFALDRLDGCEMNCYGAFVPFMGAIGAGVGTLVDALRRTTTLYVISEPDLDAGAAARPGHTIAPARSAVLHVPAIEGPRCRAIR